MLAVGITGGIGTGKSTVCKIFAALGIPILYADDLAKQLVQNDEQIRQAIQLHFGVDIYNQQGVLNKKLLAERAFANEENTTKLNSILHPIVIEKSKEWHALQTSAPYTIKEAALLIESGSYEDCDFVIGVQSPLALRIERAMLRDNATRNQIEARIQKQMPEEEKATYCDFIIQNSNEHLLIPQVLQIHQQLLERA
jgi:dephospho-CoA kinase